MGLFFLNCPNKQQVRLLRCVLFLYYLYVWLFSLLPVCVTVLQLNNNKHNNKLHLVKFFLDLQMQILHMFSLMSMKKKVSIQVLSHMLYLDSKIKVKDHMDLLVLAEVCITTWILLMFWKITLQSNMMLLFNQEKNSLSLILSDCIQCLMKDNMVLDLLLFTEMNSTHMQAHFLMKQFMY